MIRVTFCAMTLFMLASQAMSEPPWPRWLAPAPVLPIDNTNETIVVDSVSKLYQAVKTAKPGATIALADGHYYLPSYLEIRTDGLTLRGLSGKADRVVLDGSRSRHGELLGIRACTGVTIAHLTVQNVRWNGIKLNSNTGVQNVTIYNCIIHNVWQRGVKGVGVPKEDRDMLRPRNCRIQFCLFYNDRPKRFEDDPTDTPNTFGGDYIGGIDVMFPQGWLISDNVFIGIQGRTRQGRGAVFLWHDARDCVVERNVIINCDSGICLGNSYKPSHVDIHCTGCVVRNNFVVRCPEVGILADYTRRCLILHNTIFDPDNRLKRLIRIVHDNEGLIVANNLLSGPPMRVQTKSHIIRLGNVTGDFAHLFVDPTSGNLHLARRSKLITDAARTSASVPEDIDREQRDPHPDVGADEYLK